MTIPPGAQICIVMMSAVGDAVHVLPLINALKRHDSRLRITWVLQPLPASLVRGHPSVDEIVPFDPARGWRAFMDFARATRGRRFDVVIDLQVAMKAGVVTALIRATRKVGFDRARARDLNWLFTTERIPRHAPQHVQDQYLEFLSYLGVKAEPVDWQLEPLDEERDWQRQFYSVVDAPAAVLNIASSNPDRDWMPERWVAVIDALHDAHGLRAIVVGGASERERRILDSIRESTRHQPVAALGSGFRRLVSIIDGSALVIALDSAPLHIAVALGRPVISLTANADPRRTGPFRSYQDLNVDAYHDEGEVAPISMRRRRGRMERIQVSDVLERVNRWEAKYRNSG